MSYNEIRDRFKAITGGRILLPSEEGEADVIDAEVIEEGTDDSPGVLSITSLRETYQGFPSVNLNLPQFNANDWLPGQAPDPLGGRDPFTQFDASEYTDGTRDPSAIDDLLASLDRVKSFEGFDWQKSENWTAVMNGTYLGI